MTVTIIPAESRPGGSAGAFGGGRPRIRLIFVASSALILVAVTATWFATRSTGHVAAHVGATPPAAAAARAATLPAQGWPQRRQLLAVSAPVFAAMNATLGFWQQAGPARVRVHRHPGPVDGRIDQCAGIRFRPTTRVTSGPFRSVPYQGEGEIDVFANPAAARTDFAATYGPAARSCGLPVITRAMRGGTSSAAPLTVTDLTVASAPGMRGARLMRVVAGYVVNGHPEAYEIEFVSTVVGRTQLTFSVETWQIRPDRRQEMAALRAMVKTWRPRLA